MKAFTFATVLAAASAFTLAAAQRINGDSACLTSCYDISVAVTQCPDLSDPGVVSCICPNATQVATLNSCETCINTLTGITDYEKQSIQTLHSACANGGTLPSSSVASAGSAANSGTIAAGTAAATGVRNTASASAGSATAATTSAASGAAFKGQEINAMAMFGTVLLGLAAIVIV